MVALLYLCGLFFALAYVICVVDPMYYCYFELRGSYNFYSEMVLEIVNISVYFVLLRSQVVSNRLLGASQPGCAFVVNCYGDSSSSSSSYGMDALMLPACFNVHLTINNQREIDYVSSFNFDLRSTLQI